MKKGVFSKLVVNVVFTAAVLYIFMKTYVEPTTLIVSWFAFTTGELGALAGIKIKKSKNIDAN
jgi:hypothetical protein